MGWTGWLSMVLIVACVMCAYSLGQCGEPSREYLESIGWCSTASNEHSIEALRCPMDFFHTCVPLSPVATNDSELAEATSNEIPEMEGMRRVRKIWKTDGWAVLQGALEDWFVDAVARFVVNHLPNMSGSGDGLKDAHLGLRIQDAWAWSAEVRSLAEDPVVLAFIKMLTGREPQPFQTLNFRYGTQQPPHSDIMHFGTLPQGLMVAAFAALEDMHPDAGPLIVYPHSHLQRVAYFEDLGV